MTDPPFTNALRRLSQVFDEMQATIQKLAPGAPTSIWMEVFYQALQEVRLVGEKLPEPKKFTVGVSAMDMTTVTCNRCKRCSEVATDPYLESDLDDLTEWAAKHVCVVQDDA